MVFFKSCPRCHGDMHINYDIYGDYKECLHCGLMQDLNTSNDILASVPAKLEKKRVAKKTAKKVA